MQSGKLQMSALVGWACLMLLPAFEANAGPLQLDGFCGDVYIMPDTFPPVGDPCILTGFRRMFSSAAIDTSIHDGRLTISSQSFLQHDWRVDIQYSNWIPGRPIPIDLSQYDVLLVSGVEFNIPVYFQLMIFSDRWIWESTHLLNPGENAIPLPIVPANHMPVHVQTIRVRFEDYGYVYPTYFEVDDLSFDTIPEPDTRFLSVIGLGMLLLCRRLLSVRHPETL
jgi:hypothetical protein